MGNIFGKKRSTYIRINTVSGERSALPYTSSAGLKPVNSCATERKAKSIAGNEASHSFHNTKPAIPASLQNEPSLHCCFADVDKSCGVS